MLYKKKNSNKFLQDGFRFIQPVGENTHRFFDYKTAFIFFVIPFLNLFILMHEIQLSFFYILKLKGIK